MYTEQTAMEERKSGLYDLTAKVYESQNIKYLGLASGLCRIRMWTNFKASTPYDLSVHKFEANPAWNPFLKALGVAGVTLPGEDLYAAMEGNLIEGYLTNTFLVWPTGLYEVTHYVIDPPFYRNGFKFMANLDSWKRLPPDLQKLVMDVAIELEPERDKFEVQLDQELLQKCLGAGMETIKFSPADSKWFLDQAYNSQWDRIIAQDPVNGPKLKAVALQ